MKNTGEINALPRSGAKSGALDAAGKTIDPDLAAIVAAWPFMPEQIKAYVIAMAQVAKGTS